jgi:hypothetical protein
MVHDLAEVSLEFVSLGCNMSKGSIIDLKAESKVYPLAVSSNQPLLVDEFAFTRSKNDRPAEDRSIERLMALAKELAQSDRQQAGLSSEDRQPRDRDRESDNDCHVETPPVLSPRPKRRPSLGKRTSHALLRFLITFGVGVVATLAWQSYGDAAREMIASSAPQLGWLAPQAAAQARGVSDSVAPNAPAAPSPDLQQLQAMLLDLAAVRRSVDQLAAQAASGHQQIAADIAALQAAQQAILRKIPAPPPRQAAPAHNAVQLTPSFPSEPAR